MILAYLGFVPEETDPSAPPVGSIVKSIGSVGRDYSTVSLWEADLDTGAYSAADDAYGQMYDDSAFDETVTIDGGGTVGLNSITLQGASGERHTGIAGTGVRFVQSSAKAIIVNVSLAGGVTVEWIDFNFGGFSNASGCIRSAFNSGNLFRLRNCIVHDSTGPTSDCYLVRTANAAARILNNVIYTISSSAGSGQVNGIDIGSTIRSRIVANNTVYNIQKTGGTGNAYGIAMQDDADHSYYNNCVMGTNGGTSGTKADFSVASPAASVCSNNLSSDTSAPGSGSLTSKTASNQFVSLTGGSEDFQLKAGADCIDAGVDLVTTPTNVNIDIDGRDRDAQGDTWDIGANEYVVAATVGMTFLRRKSTLLRM